MPETFSCQDCQSRLFDLVTSDLTALEKQAIHLHIETCPDCEQALSSIWALEAAASRWQRESVPRWNRRSFFFEADRSMVFMGIGSVLASILLLVLVITQTSISLDDGLTVKFGSDAYATTEDIDRRLEALKQDQVQLLARELTRLRSQQVTSDQLVLNTLLQTSRAERRDDMVELVSVLGEVDARKTVRTEEALQFLINTQREDRRDIEQLTQAMTLVGQSGDSL